MANPNVRQQQRASSGKVPHMDVTLLPWIEHQPLFSSGAYLVRHVVFS